MIVCIVGLSGSGKGEVATLFKKKGFRIVEMGDIVKNRMRSEGLIPGKRNTREYSLAIRKKYGKDIVAKFVFDEIKKGKGNIVISGVRSTIELDYFKKKLKSVSIVAVLAPELTRYRRLKSRGKSDDPKCLNDFRWTERREMQGYMNNKKELSCGLRPVIENADYCIYNTGTLQDLRKNVYALIKSLEKATSLKSAR